MSPVRPLVHTPSLKATTRPLLSRRKPSCRKAEIATTLHPLPKGNVVQRQPALTPIASAYDITPALLYQSMLQSTSLFLTKWTGQVALVSAKWHNSRHRGGKVLLVRRMFRGECWGPLNSDGDFSVAGESPLLHPSMTSMDQRCIFEEIFSVPLTDGNDDSGKLRDVRDVDRIPALLDSACCRRPWIHTRSSSGRSTCTT